MAQSKYRFVKGELVLVEGEELPDKPLGALAVHTFHEGWYEHIGDDPIYIESMAQLKRECDKRGETSAYERDTSYFRRSTRWV